MRKRHASQYANFGSLLLFGKDALLKCYLLLNIYGMEYVNSINDDIGFLYLSLYQICNYKPSTSWGDKPVA